MVCIPFLVVGGYTTPGYSEARLRKLVRFGAGEGHSMEDDSGWSEHTTSIKDSGIDTGLSSSSQTLCEEAYKVYSGRLHHEQ